MSDVLLTTLCHECLLYKNGTHIIIRALFQCWLVVLVVILSKWGLHNLYPIIDIMDESISMPITWNYDLSPIIKLGQLKRGTVKEDKSERTTHDHCVHFLQNTVRGK